VQGKAEPALQTFGPSDPSWSQASGMKPSSALPFQGLLSNSYHFTGEASERPSLTPQTMVNALFFLHSSFSFLHSSVAIMNKYLCNYLFHGASPNRWYP
jgi:hypothetical protein